MSDDISDIADYYDQSVEAEAGRLAVNQLELDLTWRYLDKYLPPKGTILEIGAATGRYTLDLARRGYQVTAVDLSPMLLAKNRQLTADAGLTNRVDFFVADARDLAPIRKHDFDVVLNMGPLYHLIEESDRLQALAESVDRLRPGGLMVTAFISRIGIFGHLVKSLPGWIENEGNVRAHLDQGRRPDGARRGGFRGYFARPEELEPLHTAVALETLVVAGIEPAISADDASYNRLEGEQRRRWLDLFFEISAEPSLVGASRHLLCIGRKPES